MFVVLEVFLIEQADLLVEGVEFSFHDIFDDVGGFALHVFAFALDLAFAFEDVGWDVTAPNVERAHCGDLECERAHELSECGVSQGFGFAGPDFNENAEF
ncbi:MAG: hypothetical protein RIS92_2981 [Verrucomicrobiota bacterium]